MGVGKKPNEVHVMSHALFRLGLKLSQLKDIESEFQDWLLCLESMPRLNRFVMSRRVPKKLKLDLLKDSVFRYLDKPMQAFLTTSINNSTIFLCKDIFHAFLKLKDKRQGTIRPYIESSITLPGDKKKEIQAHLETYWKKQIQLSSTINPSLIAGLKITTENIQIDFSLKKRLKELEQIIQKKRVSGVVYED